MPFVIIFASVACCAAVLYAAMPSAADRVIIRDLMADQPVNPMAAALGYVAFFAIAWALWTMLPA